MGGISDLFGYVLNFLYDLVNNYGIAIILFSILLRLILLPITYSQQKSLKKNEKIQKQIKDIQNKYKNNQEKINQETMELYKKEKINPLSGCLSGIAQIVIILCVFWLVSQPLTHMKHVQNTDVYKEYSEKVSNQENKVSYKEIAIINAAETDYREINNSLSNPEVENKEELESKKNSLEEIRLNMEFLGLDLSKVPTQNMSDIRVFIIPALYVISSFISIKITTSSQKKNKDENTEKSDEPKEMESMQNMSKSMTYIMPIMSVSIAVIAPLGLALYWLISNVLMILERLVIQKIVNIKEEKENA